MEVELREFEWEESLFALFARFYTFPQHFFLYSSLPNDTNSRFSYLGCKPGLIFSSKQERITVTRHGEVETFVGDPFDLFDQLISDRQRGLRFDRQILGSDVFSGGAVGYWGYDMKDHIESLHVSSKDDLSLPDSYWMFFDAVVMIDHATNKKYLIGAREAFDHLEQVIKTQPQIGDAKNFDFEFQSTVGKKEYLHRIEAIKNNVAAGDVYEINLSQRFDVHFKNKDSWTEFHVFKNLVEASPSAYSAFLNCGGFSVISSSPERFLKIHDRHCESKPIKGTRPRAKDFHKDEKHFVDLYYSEKDRAENLMIVDLVRNDLGRVAEIGSVKVDRIFVIEKYATVFQMVSTITADLGLPYTIMDAVRSCFPAGSMTGTPKIRAMQIIDQLEQLKRGIYSGALGYIDFDGNLDLSVVIRTLISYGDRASFQTGGAIVWDSIPEDEYDECWHKARGILNALENLKTNSRI
jgi:para-aminobenzoate synthetase component 1